MPSSSTQVELAVNVPELFAPLFKSGTTVVEHAHVSFPIAEGILASAMSRTGTVLVLTPDKVEELLDIVRGWFLSDGVALRPQRLGNARVLQVNGSTLWIADEIPANIRRVDHLLILNAHNFLAKPKGIEKADVITGAIAPRTHWFYSHCREAEERGDLTKWNVDALKETFRVEYDAKHPETRRIHHLEDVDVRTPFLQFASTRLHIRTDKGPTFLDAEQQEEAKRQLGENWTSDAAGTPVLPFRPSRLQRKYLAVKRLARKKGYRKFLILKYRRGGITTIEQGQSYRVCAQQPYSHCVTIAHTQSSTARIFRMVDLFQERDPYAVERANDSKTALELANGSFFFISTAGGRGALRGDTINCAHGSEVSRWFEGLKNQIEEVSDLVAAINGAASNGEVVFETTAKGHEWFAAAYKEAKKGLNDYYPIFLPWYMDPANVASYVEEEILDTLKEVERELIEKQGLTFAQIAFRRKITEEYKHLRPQEYPENDVECFIASGIPWFNLDSLQWLSANVELEQGETRKGGTLWIWEEPQPGVEYCAGVDTSEGLPGCDPNGIGILRRDSGKQVAAMHGSYSITDQALLFGSLAHRYNNALLGLERNNHGHAVLVKLIDLSRQKGWNYHRPHYMRGKLFYFAPDKPGWDTNAVSRPQMLDAISDLVDDSPETVRDAIFVDEAATFKKQPNGKFEADPGCHDDTVMKWAIAASMRTVKVVKPKITFVDASGTAAPTQAKEENEVKQPEKVAVGRTASVEIVERVD